MLRTTDLDYTLPPERIARRPAEPRDAARLLVISRTDDSRLEHATFADIHRYLRAGDLLVTNRSGVLPARFTATRDDSGGTVTGLFLRQDPDATWHAMLRANGRLRPGLTIRLVDRNDNPTDAVFTLAEKDARHWTLIPRNPDDAHALLDRVGHTPLPPYILGARRETNDRVDDDLDRRWYQTVYARDDQRDSVAAPTAGLHFTQALTDRLASAGVEFAEVILHVGAGTFAPVQCDVVEEHPIHAERVRIPARTDSLLRSDRAGRRVVAVGTTTVRAIESLPEHAIPSAEHAAETSLFITPGFHFRFTDALITNFHLPRSTLLALVGAFLPGGVPRLLDVYRHAIDAGYRFYSYGDAMLILP